MKTDVTSMFFNSTIDGKTATPAWGTSIGQSKLRGCRIDDYKPEVVNMLIGMTYMSVSDLSKLDVSKGSSKREVVLCSIFTDIYINETKVKNSQFVLLLVREHSDSHDGRLIISYAPYISYNNISNQFCIENMRKVINCNEQGCWFVYDISIKNQSQLHFKAVVVDPNNPKKYNKSTTSQFRSSEWNAMIPENEPQKTFSTLQFAESSILQQIYYGAPGTGKSHTINKITKDWDVIRTTFHPDSDYSTFVGAYKPTVDMLPICDEAGQQMKINDVGLKKKQITYKFVRQAFLNAYLSAWKKYAKGQDGEVEPQFLIIEEINRGNCAQIFGDIFQLLDRADNGFSSYPIVADDDIRKSIEQAFSEDKDYKIEQLSIEGAVNNYKSNYGDNLSVDVRDGRILLLPPNLYIWATMNTSDQSLFPIDSAFKRRWDWKYIKITNAFEKDDNGNYKTDEKNNKIPLGWKIKIDETYEKDWWEFLEKINAIISNMTSSADKQLGYFFCKADEKKEISAEKFVSKVVFYLWNDVFKDYGFEDSSLFSVKVKDHDGKDTDKDLTYPDFFDEDGNVNVEITKQFVDNVMSWSKKNENNL